MFTPYTVPSALSALQAPSVDATLIPIDEYGMSPITAALLQGAGARTGRVLKRWLLDLAERAPVSVTAADGRAYDLKALPRAWQGRKLRTWMQDQRQLQCDASELTLRGARLNSGVQVYPDEATECLDAQAVLSIHEAGQDEPVGYATVLVSVRIPQVVRTALGDFRVSDTFEEFYDVRRPQVELKLVLDEVFVLPQHRGLTLGNRLAEGVQTACSTLLKSLEFLTQHAPMVVDLDAEVVSFAGAQYVNKVRELLCHSLTTDLQWELQETGYPTKYAKGEVELHLRHDFQSN
jgi:hypothetical protein